MLLRSLSRAEPRCPVLKGVSVYEDGVDAGNLLGTKSDADRDEVRRGFEAFLEEFAELLGQMLGRELATVLLREAMGGEGQS